MQASFVSLPLASTLPLQLVSSPYITGTAGVEPAYTPSQSVALVSGAGVAGDRLFAVSGSQFSINAGFVVISGADAYAAPPCTLSCTLSSGWGVFYIWKKKSGDDATTSKLGFLSTPSASSASSALSAAQSSLTGVYIPLCVVSVGSGEMTEEWSLSANSQYTEPIFNQLSSILSWQQGTKTFIENQLSALMTDLTGFASWEQGAHSNQVYVSFDVNASANGISVLGEWTPGGNPGFVLPNITGSYLTRSYALTVCPFNITSTVPTITFPQIHNTNNGEDYWFAPSEPLYFPACCSAWQNGSLLGVINGVWGTNGDLVLTGSAPVGQEHLPNTSVLSPIPDGISVNRYNGTQQIQTLSPNPLSNPTFQTGW